MLILFQTPAISATPAQASQPKGVAALMEQITPPAMEQGTTQGSWGKFRGDCLAISVLVDLRLEEMKKDQARTVKELKRDRTRMDADLRHPEVERLRALLDDPDFKAASARYQLACDKIRKEVSADREARRGLTFTPEEQAKRFQGGYAEAWASFKTAAASYQSSISAASLAASQAVPGSTTDAASRALDIRLLQAVQQAASLHKDLARP